LLAVTCCSEPLLTVACPLQPADSNFGETLSTLKFAQRAKLIKTRAILNEVCCGTAISSF